MGRAEVDGKISSGIVTSRFIRKENMKTHKM